MTIGDQVTDHNGERGVIVRLAAWGQGYIVRLGQREVLRYESELEVKA